MCELLRKLLLFIIIITKTDTSTITPLPNMVVGLLHYKKNMVPQLYIQKFSNVQVKVVLCISCLEIFIW